MQRCRSNVWLCLPTCIDTGMVSLKVLCAVLQAFCSLISGSRSIHLIFVNAKEVTKTPEQDRFECFLCNFAVLRHQCLLISELVQAVIAHFKSSYVEVKSVILGLRSDELNHSPKRHLTSETTSSRPKKLLSINLDPLLVNVSLSSEGYNPYATSASITHAFIELFRQACQWVRDTFTAALEHVLSRPIVPTNAVCGIVFRDVVWYWRIAMFLFSAVCPWKRP